jgi:hypothetical protein
MTFTSVYRFLERYSKLASSDDLIYTFSNYLIEATIFNISMYKWKNSILAVSAIFLANRIMGRSKEGVEFVME